METKKNIQSINYFTLRRTEALRDIRFSWMINYQNMHSNDSWIRDDSFHIKSIRANFFKKTLKKCKKDSYVLSNFNKRKNLKFCPEIEHLIFLWPGAPARNLRGNKEIKKSHQGKNYNIL